MKMSVIVTFDNPETAAIAVKAAQKIASEHNVFEESFTVTQSDNIITVDMDETGSADPRVARMAVMKLKSIIDILYTLA